jgi:hypothetical protein
VPLIVRGAPMTTPSALGGKVVGTVGPSLQSKRLVIESRWVSKPLAFAGKLRPRRLNN